MLDKPPTESDERDAIHMAVIPAVAGCRLMPGQPVVIKDDVAFASLGISPVGVVNPFRSSIVEVGDRFWLCLKPGTVTGLLKMDFLGLRNLTILRGPSTRLD